jgi:small subunit ribosomal protein S6
MAEQRVYNYEGMFLVSQAAASDFKGVVDHIRSIIEKQGGTIVAMRKWDERRLAYEIDKQKRGLYILTYFSAPNVALAQIERNCNLSEQIMRVLLLRCDHLSIDEMKAADDAKGLETEAKLRASQPAMATADTGPASAPETGDDGEGEGEPE